MRLRRVFRISEPIRFRSLHRAYVLLTAISLAACAPDYSPNTYQSNAVQRAAKVTPGVVIGVRKVQISVDATISTAAGGAAGGIAGSQTGSGAVGALGALGGSVAGGLIGNMVGHEKNDTFGFEYIVRKGDGELVSVTQKDDKPLKLGQHVLIIEGVQARIVNDYTVPIDGESSEDRPPPEPQPAMEPQTEIPAVIKPVPDSQPQAQPQSGTASPESPQADSEAVAPVPETTADSPAAGEAGEPPLDNTPSTSETVSVPSEATPEAASAPSGTAPVPLE